MERPLDLEALLVKQATPEHHWVAHLLGMQQPVLHADGTTKPPATPQVARAIIEHMYWADAQNDQARAQAKPQLYKHRTRAGTAGEKRVRALLRNASISLHPGEPATINFPTRWPGATMADRRAAGRLAEIYADLHDQREIWCPTGFQLETGDVTRDFSRTLDPAAYALSRGRWQSGYVDASIAQGEQTHDLRTRIVLDDDHTQVFHLHYGLRYLTSEGLVRDKIHLIADVDSQGLTTVYHAELETPAGHLLKQLQQPVALTVNDHHERELHRDYGLVGDQYKTDMRNGDTWTEGVADIPIRVDGAHFEDYANYEVLRAQPDLLGGQGFAQAVAYATAHHDELRAVYGALSERKENGKRT